MDVSLVMFKADGTRRDFPVKKDRIVIGRKPTCDLRIPLSSVSRQHCAIELDDDVVRVRDLGSSNGTFHNSERVQEHPLAAGDELTVGPVVFTVVIDGEPREIEPVRSLVEDDGVRGGVGEGADAAAQSAVSAAPDDDDELAELAPLEDDEDDEPAAVTAKTRDGGATTDTGAGDDLDMDDPLAALARMAEEGEGDDEPLSLDDAFAEEGQDAGADHDALAGLGQAAAEDTGEVEVILDDEEDEDEEPRPRGRRR